MIDWITCIFPINEKIYGGKTVSFSPTGAVEYESEKFLRLEGSYSHKISVRSIPKGCCEVLEGQSTEHQFAKFNNPNALSLGGYEIYISGNLTKYLQGHNVFGTNDLQGLMVSFVAKISQKLGFSRDLADQFMHL